MGNQTTSFKKSYIDNCLKFDRILDADSQVYIGIGNIDEYPTQVIRIGDYTNKYYKLIEFREEEKKLHYKFENNISMTLEKIDDNVMMNIEIIKDNNFLKLMNYNKKIISKQLDTIIVKYFKPIKFNDLSNELDKMHQLFNK